MKRIVMMMMMVFLLVGLIYQQAGIWTDEFDKKALDKDWEFRDRREKETNPDGKWEHMTPDKAMLERDVPASSQDLVVSGIFFKTKG